MLCSLRAERGGGAAVRLWCNVMLTCTRARDQTAGLNATRDANGPIIGRDDSRPNALTLFVRPKSAGTRPERTPRVCKPQLQRGVVIVAAAVVMATKWCRRLGAVPCA